MCCFALRVMCLVKKEKKERKSDGVRDGEVRVE